jgi:hypothetical protein
MGTFIESSQWLNIGSMYSTLIANKIGLKDYLKSKGSLVDENYDLIQVVECFEALNMDGD